MFRAANQGSKLLLAGLLAGTCTGAALAQSPPTTLDLSSGNTAWISEGTEWDAVPGGPQCLVLAGYQPKFSWAGWRWMKFLKNLSQPARIVLIAHDDCRWYIENRYVPHPSEAREHQIKDLRQARAELGERFGKVSIELFYATLDGDSAQFEQL